MEKNMAKTNENDFRNVTWTRKAESWSDAELVSDTAAIDAAAWLLEFPAYENPTDDFLDVRPQFHVEFTNDGTRFLVDTQGYGYARYIARLPNATKYAYYRVTIVVDYEAETPEQAKEYAKELIGHVMRTGAEADIVCPEEIQVLDDVKGIA